MVAVRTIEKSYTGDMFFAPCLKELEGKNEDSGRTVLENPQPEE
jgi:hypothetical protein